MFDLKSEIKWRSFREAEADRNYLVLLTSLELKRYWSVPKFLRLSRTVQAQLAQSEGLLGYTMLAGLLSKTYWTLSVWEDEEKLSDFRTNVPHVDVMEELGPDRTGTKFKTSRWKISGSAVPPSWKDALERAGAS